MARLKFDVTGVDPAGEFETPKPGAYKAKIDSIEHKQSAAGNDMLEVQYLITGGEFDNSRLWDYYPLHVQWKYRRFLEAVGLVRGGKEKGELNTEALIGKRVLIKITNEEYEGNTRARVQTV